MVATFDPRNLDRSAISVPLRQRLTADFDALHDVIFDVSLDFRHGSRTARDELEQRIVQRVSLDQPAPGVEFLDRRKTELTTQYVFARLRGATLVDLVVHDEAQKERKDRAIFRVWPDFEIETLACKSVATVKANAAHAAFQALGEGIVWAVIDSGIDAAHPHFARWCNLEGLPEPVQHESFVDVSAPTTDPYGHGTHVAGVLAGEGAPGAKGWVRRAPTQAGTAQNEWVEAERFERIGGMAPKTKLVSLQVLDAAGRGNTSSIIAAIATIQRWNENGRKLRVHGVNLSVGYGFDAEWFACGHSPLCVEVDRLVRSGVVVVTAAGNTGYGEIAAQAAVRRGGLGMSINDPGNAELAITVGATHRDMPHMYGVSYFSSKGPTGDGRLKPDLVAPGERILSCASGSKRAKVAAASGIAEAEIGYVEDSGTSMAAPHVSGVIAAFLSIRVEFVGRPEKVKELFLKSATDLGRERYFQGHGLVDLMRAIQSV